MSARRVVITGVGLVTPLGASTEVSWRKLIAGESGLREIDGFKIDDLPAKVAGLIPQDGAEGAFNVEDVMSAKDARRNDPFVLYGIGAASEAIEDSGWKPESEEDRCRTGVLIGSGIGGLGTIANTAVELETRGPRRVSPFFITASLINLVSGQVSIKFGFKGPNHSVVTACSTGAHAIGDASRLIQLGDADVMVAGGAEGAVCRLGIAGFASMKALSTNYNETPTKASRPWDKGRDGFVMGEGAGIVVLEELEHARSRGARIYGEVIGYGLSGDAYHITAPSPDGDGGYRSMRMALERAGLQPEDIDYINAHGTSTPLGDEIELGAVKRLFGKAAGNLSMSSTKSAIGHLLGAAGGVEAIFALLAIHHQTVPPTLNLDDPSEGCDLDLVPHQAKQREVRTVLSNSFGFGGTNATVVLTKPPEN